MPVAFTDEHNIKTCIMKDNFTYISDVEFWNTTTFKNDSEVFFEKDVTFKDNVKFTYDVTFEDDVYIQNDHKDTYFEVNGKVKVEFEPDHTIHINKDTEFAKDVTIDGDLDVDGHTYLDSTTVDGDLSVKDELTVDGEIYAKGGITSKSDVTIEYGKLYVERDGIHVVGYSEFANDVHIVEDLSVRDLEVRRNKIYAGDLTVKGALNAQKTLTVQGAVKAEAALTVDGPFTANGGSTIWLGQTLNAGANPAARRLAGEARGLQSRVGLTVNGNVEVDGSGTFSGVLTGGSLETIPPTQPPTQGRPITTISSTELVDMLGSYEGVVRIGTLETDKIDTGVLDVATEAHVGEDKILTTADVDTIADQPTTTETVNECTCDAQMIRDAINGQDVTLGTLTAQTVQVRGGYMIWDPVNEVYVPFGGGGGGGCGCGSDDISAMGFITQSEVECSCSEAAEDPSE
jgi:cytoskeletal protein CcmA (bactofilin family)